MMVDGYVRVSRVAGRGGESFHSPDLQRSSVEAYAAVHGLEIATWHEDLDESGGTLDRPGLQAALARCSSGATGGVIAARLDRLTRSLAGLGSLIEQAQDGGWRLVAVDYGLDIKTAPGRLVAEILGAVAQWERERLREGWDTAQARAVAGGVHIASRVPTGYRRREGQRRLEPDPRAARAVRELFRRRARGAGWTELARFLDSQKISGPYGNQGWTPSVASNIVRNRVYLGEARSGRHVNPGAHEPIVSAAEWSAAQSSGRTPSSPRSATGALLSGLVRCAGCRYLAKPDTMRGRDGSRLRIYRCRARHAAGTCAAPATVMGRILEPWVEEQFLAALGPRGSLAEAAANTVAIDLAAGHVEQAEHELATYRDEPLIVTTLGRERFLEGLEVRAVAVDAARDELARARGCSALAEAIALTPGNLAEAWPGLSIPHRRQLLAAAIDCVIVRAVRGAGSNGSGVSERALILWRGTAPSDLPRRGHRVTLAPFPWPRERPADVGV